MIPIPSWDAVHPVIIHFPVALLLITPVFLFLRVIRPAKAECFSMAAMILMLLGTIAAFVAVESGEAALSLVDRTNDVAAALDAHADMADKVPWIFLTLTLLYGGLLALPHWWTKPSVGKWLSIFHILFLLSYVGGAGWLGLAAHRGGLLVHHYGLRAPI